MKRVLVFGMSENLGGVETVIMNYYRFIDKNKLQFDFLYNTVDIAYKDEIKKMGGKLFKITPRSENLIQYRKDIDSFFKNHSKDYDCMWVNLCILTNIDWMIYAKKYGIKNVILHSHNSKSMGNLFRKILHYLNKIRIKSFCDDYWACSESAGKWFFGSKIDYKIINNCIIPENFAFNSKERISARNELNISDSDFVVGHIGRFHFQKNHEFLIEIFNEISKIKENSKLILIGTGEDENKIRNLVKEKKLCENVLFLGLRKDINKLYQSMDVFLLPSLFEGLPLVLVEAQANGLPVFVSRESVTDSVKMSVNLSYISLNKNAKYWADLICSSDLSRKDNYMLIKKAGFDIKTEAKKLEEYFLQVR